jgi:hypothetical protein
VVRRWLNYQPGVDKARAAILHPVLFAALVLLCGVTCPAQSNINPSVAPTTGPPTLTGFRVATVTYTLVLQVGSGPRSFRIIRGAYWTDSSGQLIPLADLEARNPGDKLHHFTRIVLGPASFSLPLPPLAAGLIGITLILLGGYIALARAVRGKAAERHSQDTCAMNSD